MRRRVNGCYGCAALHSQVQAILAVFGYFRYELRSIKKNPELLSPMTAHVPKH